MLKVRIVSKQENYETYKSMLEKAGFTISDDADLVLKETDFVQETFLGEKDEQLEIIHVSKIVMFESFGRTIILHTLKDQFKIREKLYELDNILDNHLFIRINKSMIIAKAGISKIKPYINGRIMLMMKNGMILSVSRSYSNDFKRFIGF